MNKLHQRLIAVLKRHFGFNHFRPGQEAVLEALIQKQNVLAVLPTGSGKTLIYQLYGYLSSRPILIISPLLSLMQDQVSRMQYLGIKDAVALNSILSAAQKNYVLSHLNRFHYLYASPEMLANYQVQNELKSLNLGLVVIDEAHCISQWGPDFRPEYLNLRSVLINLGRPQALLLTATASKNLRHDILNKLGLRQDQVKEIIYPVDRPNIFLDVRTVQNPKDKDRILIQLVNHLKAPGVIYFSSKKQADRIARLLRRECQIRVEPYHSGLSTGSRYRIQHQFMNNQLDVICATSAFGMGVDKDDIRFVIHYHLPADLGIYMQEIGRAGRDGKQSIAILLYQDGDEDLPQTLSVDSIPDRTVVENFFAAPQRFLKYQNQNDQIAVLNYYLVHHFTSQQVVQILDHYRQRRRIALRKMVEYVKINQCKRAFLLQFFDKGMPKHNAVCCNYRQSPNLKAMGLLVNRAHRKKQMNLDWRPVIQHLFKI